MLTIVGIAVAAAVLGLVISHVMDLLPRSRTRDSLERFHCDRGIPGEMSDRKDHK